MPKSKISKPEVKQPRVVLRSSVAEILSAYDKQIYSVEQAAQMLGVSRPTFFRRLKAWRETGQIPLHGNNGHAPSNKIPDETRQRVIGLVRTKYHDFQASLLTKYLREQEGITVSVEWVRRLLCWSYILIKLQKNGGAQLIHCVDAERVVESLYRSTEARTSGSQETWSAEP